MPAKVLFDTTVLCGAFLDPAPGALCMALLEFARLGIIDPIFTQEVVAEWVRNAKSGRLGGIRYDDEDLDAFCDLIEPLLSIEALEQVRIGRYQVPLHAIAKVGKGFQLITQHPTRGYAHTITHMRDARTAILKDPADAHLFQVALDLECDFVCSSNIKDLPQGLAIGKLRCMTPESLMALIRDDLLPS